ncbi:hypothetical protein ZIOFF_011630 [Zingiber officinale]|uniref:Nucleotide-diphospho-sugar transferase domain-containing protein n=1 Tax=Zingiber officinale TaxID=94328 RepID=A0A8J5I6D7_ZINOF|nr:hypothetical protein ZIOFF_011630 [Zingiber officinale]
MPNSSTLSSSARPSSTIPQHEPAPIYPLSPLEYLEGFPRPDPKHSETITAISRDKSGKNISSKERKAGRVPSIVFEQEDGQHGGNKRLISVQTKQIRKLVDHLGRSFFLSRLFEQLGLGTRIRNVSSPHPVPYLEHRSATYFWLGLYGQEKNDVKLEKVLKEAAMENKTLILTTLNAAWASPGSIIDLFFQSFRTRYGTRRLMDHLVIIALDKKAYIRCISLHTHCFALYTEGMDFSDEKIYMTAGYLSMMWRRIEFLRVILEMGYNFIFSFTNLKYSRVEIDELADRGSGLLAVGRRVLLAVDRRVLLVVDRRVLLAVGGRVLLAVGRRVLLAVGRRVLLAVGRRVLLMAGRRVLLAAGRRVLLAASQQPAAGSFSSRPVAGSRSARRRVLLAEGPPQGPARGRPATGPARGRSAVGSCSQAARRRVLLAAGPSQGPARD